MSANQQTYRLPTDDRINDEYYVRSIGQRQTTDRTFHYLEWYKFGILVESILPWKCSSCNPGYTFSTSTPTRYGDTWSGTVILTITQVLDILDACKVDYKDCNNTIRSKLEIFKKQLSG